MKKKITLVLSLFIIISSYSQNYEFKTIKEIDALPVISQDNTGTCWSFSSISFLESEILRLTGKKMDLSEMYNVKYTYLAKAENYVMRQGKAQFGEGGLNHDVINSAKKYGIVYESSYTGKLKGSDKFDHSKLVAELEKVVKRAVELTPAKYTSWKNDYIAILDNHMGKFDNETTFFSNAINKEKNSITSIKKISPKQILENSTLQLDDYVTITSFTHEPFYRPFVLNVPDNFSNGSMYNVTLDEFIQNIDNALDNGFTLALDTDVSEPTFSAKKGIAVLPENVEDVNEILTSIKSEMRVTAELRQRGFETYATTDDHLMHIVGKVQDQNGNIYYKVKNSWGQDSGKDGYIYMSVPYIRMKAISVMVHKDGLTKITRKNLKL